MIDNLTIFFLLEEYITQTAPATACVYYETRIIHNGINALFREESLKHLDTGAIRTMHVPYSPRSGLRQLRRVRDLKSVHVSPYRGISDHFETSET